MHSIQNRWSSDFRKGTVVHLHVMRENGDGRGGIALLILSLSSRSKRPAVRYGLFNLRKQLSVPIKKAGWLGPKAGLEVLEKRKSLLLLPLTRSLLHRLHNPSDISDFSTSTESQTQNRR
jgi:hypothetical protein